MSFFGNTVKTPAPSKKVLNIDADQVNTNQEGIVVPYMAGRRRIALKWFTPAYNPVAEPVKTKVGKSDSQTTGYIYYGDLAGLFSMGGRVPTSKLFKIIVDSEIVWRNDAGLAISDSGEPVSVEGYGAVWVYPGSETQPIDSHVLTPIGDLPGGADDRDTDTWGGGGATNNHPDYPA